MRRDPGRYRRQSIRLAGFDYSQPGAYFVTICTHQRECLFGEVLGDQMRLSAVGAIVVEEWVRSAAIRHEVGATGRSPLHMAHTPLPPTMPAHTIDPEHVIRDDAEWDRIRAYIEGNPARWADDQENPIGKPRNP